MKIRNRTYENQNDWVEIPVIIEIMMVWISRISPMASGWFICVNEILNRDLIVIKVNFMSGNSLVKILILGINEKVYIFFSEVLKVFLFLVYKTNILLLNY